MNANDINKIEDIIKDLYFNLGTINSKNMIDEISSYSKLFPMFDIQTENIILVKKEELYDKLLSFNYRPINKQIYEIIVNTKSSTQKRMVEFLKNFNIELLENTFYKNIYEINPTTNDITDCIRPSYIPIMRYTTPYYSKTEMIFMALNNNIWNTNMTMKNICNIIQQNDITSMELLKHQTYIRENNADQYIKYYSFLGSSPLNYYLRIPQNNYPDSNIEKHISNFYNLLLNSPGWNKSYYFYRWINNDNYLKHLMIGDIFIDNGFTSTTRLPFINPNEHYFGYILIKIKVPANKQGSGLAIEYYSHFPAEQEIVFPPSKFKVIATTNTKYYHPNIDITDKVVTKYEFEWIEPINPLSDDFKQKLKKSFKPISIIDFAEYKYDILYGNKYELFINLLEQHDLYKKFKTHIGNESVVFNVGKIEKGQYERFFMLNHIQTTYTHNNIYFAWINEQTGETNLMIEIGEYLCVNYYFKFSGMNTKIIGDFTFDDILIFIEKLALFFNVKQIIICSDYNKFWNIIDKSSLTSNYIDLKDFHSRQLYISDTTYYNELLHHYINIKYTTNDEISDFTKYIFNNHNANIRFGKEIFHHMMDIKIKDFLNDYNTHIQNNAIINEQYIDLIIKLANKIIDGKILIDIQFSNIKHVKKNIKHSIKHLNRTVSILDQEKFIYLYFYITHYYNYLVPFLHSYMHILYGVNFDDIYIYYNVPNQMNKQNLNMTSTFININTIKLLTLKQTKRQSDKYQLI